MANKKIQMQDSKGNIIYPATVSELVTYGSGNVNDTLIDLESRDELFISDTAPDKDGLWVDTSDQNSSPNGENIVATQIKKYIDEKITSKVDDCVEKVDEMAKDVIASEFNNFEINVTSKEITNPKNGFVSNQIIEGNTLQNVKVKCDEINGSAMSVDYSNGNITINFNSTTYYNMFSSPENLIVKPNTKYTAILKIISNSASSQVDLFCGNTIENAQSKFETQCILRDVNVGEYKILLETKDDFSNCQFGDRSFLASNSPDGTMVVQYYIIEGDWTNKEIPTYFKGLSCVGEKEPISISAIGKNICPPLEIGSISNSTGADMPNDNLMRSKFIRVKPNTEYSCSNNGLSRGVNLYSFNQEKVLTRFDQAGDSNGSNVKFITDSNTHYIRVTMGMNNSDKFQIEENSSCSGYEPYREEIQLIHEPLRAIGDIKDIIDVDRGVIIRRIGKLILNGTTNENWIKAPSGGYFAEDSLSKTVNIKLYDSSLNIIPKLVSDKYPQSLHYVDNNFEDKTIRLGRHTPIQIMNTDFSDVDSFVSWIQANPITVLYELEIPIEEKINIAPLRLFDEARSVELVGNIKPTVTFDYPTNFKGIVESNTNAINKLYDERTIASNPNLLINGDFQVNQRGLVSYESGRYTVDRWRLQSDTNCILDVTSKGVKITTKRVGTWSNFSQFFDIKDFKSLVGKTLTLTFKTVRPTDKVSQIWALNSGNGKTHYYCNAGLGTNEFYENGMTDIFSTTFVLDSITDTGWIEFGIQLKSDAVGNSIELEWAKLEVGTVATPFIPRPYGEELALCQRYFERVYFSTRLVNDISSYTRAGLELNTAFKVMKRIKPSLTFESVASDSDIVPSITSYVDGSEYHFCAFLRHNLGDNNKLTKGTRIVYIGVADAEIY